MDMKGISIVIGFVCALAHVFLSRTHKQQAQMTLSINPIWSHSFDRPQLTDTYINQSDSLPPLRPVQPEFCRLPGLSGANTSCDGPCGCPACASRKCIDQDGWQSHGPAVKTSRHDGCGLQRKLLSIKSTTGNSSSARRGFLCNKTLIRGWDRGDNRSLLAAKNYFLDQ